jgi:hypothetical protein
MGVERITEFLAVVIKSKKQCLADLSIQEVDYLRGYYEISSLKRTLTRYRNAVKNSSLSVDHQTIVLKNLCLSPVESDTFRIDGKKQVSNDLLNLRPLYDIDAYIIQAEEMLDSTSYIGVIAGLCALTGRRGAEIACTAKFERIENDDTGVLFSGQLKTGKNSTDLPYRIPVLSNVDKIINALNKIRSEKTDLINAPQLFHDRCSKQLNLVTGKSFVEMSDSKITPKNMRSIYGEIAYYLLDNQSIAKSKYMSLILGHSEDDNMTSLSYMDFYIVED